MFYLVKRWILCLSMCHITYISGESLCRSELLKGFNISTELQSDVLLPCNFNPAHLGSDRTADIAVIWSQINTTVHSLVEITLQGEVRFWDYKGGRIQSFPELSESGNFSIVLQKVQPYDLSLYRCELFNGSSCSIAYQELQLKLTAENILAKTWPYIAGGGTVALTVVVVLTCFIKRARSNASNEHIYANSRFEKSKRNDKERHEEKHSSSQHAGEANNKVDAKKPQSHSNIYANRRVEAQEIYVNQQH